MRYERDKNKLSGSKATIVLVVIVKVHTLEDERTLRDSGCGISNSDLASLRMESVTYLNHRVEHSVVSESI